MIQERTFFVGLICLEFSHGLRFLSRSLLQSLACFRLVLVCPSAPADRSVSPFSLPQFCCARRLSLCFPITFPYSWELAVTILVPPHNPEPVDVFLSCDRPNGLFYVFFSFSDLSCSTLFPTPPPLFSDPNHGHRARHHAPEHIHHPGRGAGAPAGPHPHPGSVLQEQQIHDTRQQQTIRAPTHIGNFTATQHTEKHLDHLGQVENQPIRLMRRHRLLLQNVAFGTEMLQHLSVCDEGLMDVII